MLPRGGGERSLAPDELVLLPLAAADAPWQRLGVRTRASERPEPLAALVTLLGRRLEVYADHWACQPARGVRGRSPPA